MAKDKDLSRKVELTEADLERMELLQQANEKVGRQLTINSEQGNIEEIDELRELIGKEFENPEEKYNIYYKGIRKLLMDYLPKGKEFKEVRNIIYDEKNIFLNSGKRKSDNNGIRKSDGRMTFQPVMNEILDIIVKWVGDSQNPFVIYREFYELNEKHGYGHEEYDKSALSVSKAMLKLSKN
ncbi:MULTISPECIES: hypothetical protein [Bizionia]|uniref:Uncharacterized protein n=1 Tax=Bizionia algoritergicola TaxID=291187 RepID=A0A5D0QX18_9FLAO|nr:MULTISPECIES: hypothetical protein [Bizionia]OBX23334.1 hypothetical protein BAA08_04570 [Bizionia sp. APA-3]TYB73325.1 hypothetical protein ES675_06595 [Bizionia algoritergicola]UPS91305.1 hypothetical protein GMA17_06030 [Bizionia sp. M204]